MVTATAQLTATTALEVTRRAGALADTRQRLVSGQRLLPGQEPAIRLTAASQQYSLTSYREGLRNSNQASSMLEVAEQGMNRIGSLLREQFGLAQLARNETLSTNERGVLNAQFAQLGQQIDQIAQETRFNGTALLDGSTDTLQVALGKGNSLSLPLAAADRDALYAGTSPNLGTGSDAAAAYTQVGQALERFGMARATLSANRQQLDDTQTVISRAIAGLDGARDALLSTDRSQEMLRFAREAITQETGIALLAQTQQLQSSLLELMQPTTRSITPRAADDTASDEQAAARSTVTANTTASRAEAR